VQRLAAILAALLLCLGSPALAVAQLGPQNVPAPLTEDAEPETINLDEDTGFSTTQLVLTFGGAVAVVLAIAWFIMRDARGKAPAGARGRTSTSAGGSAVAAPGPKKSARERERERARKRNKAKAARDQRKRNRPR